MQIATENLTRAAHYHDLTRLGWAMGALEVADKLSGTIRKTVNEVIVTLSIEMIGKPQFSVERSGKLIQSPSAKMTTAKPQKLSPRRCSPRAPEIKETSILEQIFAKG